MKKFTVRRKKWARGGKNGRAELLNSDGNMCCLGFAACQVSRKTHEQLLNCGKPSEVYLRKSFLTDEYRPEPNWVDVSNNKLTQKAITINDSVKITDETREKRLKALFRKYGIIIKFVD